MSLVNGHEVNLTKARMDRWGDWWAPSNARLPDGRPLWVKVLKTTVGAS